MNTEGIVRAIDDMSEQITNQFKELVALQIERNIMLAETVEQGRKHAKANEAIIEAAQHLENIDRQTAESP